MKQLFKKEDTYALRGLCMICIIMHHLYQYLSYHYGVSFPSPIGLVFQSIGFLATGVFFLLSGYGLYSSCQNNNPIGWRYMLFHLLKLYLPFLFISIVELFVDIVIGQFHSLTFLISLFTIQGYWFMRVILIIYILVFLLFSVKLSNKIRIFIIGAFILLYVLLARFAFNVSPEWWNSVLCFPLGMICCYSQNKIQRLNNRIFGVTLSFIFIVSFIAYYLSSSHMCPANLRGGVVTTFFVIISSLSFSLCSVRFASIVNLRNAVFNYFGINSLSFYLFQFPLLKMTFANSPLYYSIYVFIGVLLLVSLYNLLMKNKLDLLFTIRF